MKPTLLISLALLIAFPAFLKGEEIRVGIIGLDTSHAIAFTKAMNAPRCGRCPRPGAR